MNNHNLHQSESHKQLLNTEWKIRLNTIFWFILGFGFFLSLPILLDWAAWTILLNLAIAAGLAVPAALVSKAIFTRIKGKPHKFVRHWIQTSIVLLFIICFAVAMPIYYLATITETNPVVQPQATLSNGTKTVVFQGMQHFGSENFYKSVIYDVEKALADGYVIYYESVQTSTPESKAYFKKFSKALTGSANLEGFYRAMGQACGMKFQQDYFTLLEADKQEHPERHVIADVDALEIKAEYERLLGSDPDFAKAHADDFKETEKADSSKSMADLVSWLESGSPGQRKLAGVVCRGVMTLSLGKGHQKGKFDPVVLDFRNHALAKRIIDEPRDKIFITYGANHLSGVFEDLKKQDSNWKVANVKWMRTIEMPKKEHEGTLAFIQ